MVVEVAQDAANRAGIACRVKQSQLYANKVSHLDTTIQGGMHGGAIVSIGSHAAELTQPLRNLVQILAKTQRQQQHRLRL
jgi:hypothetical protein